MIIFTVIRTFLWVNPIGRKLLFGAAALVALFFCYRWVRNAGYADGQVAGKVQGIELGRKQMEASVTEAMKAIVAEHEQNVIAAENVEKERKRLNAVRMQVSADLRTGLGTIHRELGTVAERQARVDAIPATELTTVFRERLARLRTRP